MAQPVYQSKTKPSSPGASTCFSMAEGRLPLPSLLSLSLERLALAALRSEQREQSDKSGQDCWAARRWLYRGRSSARLVLQRVKEFSRTRSCSLRRLADWIGQLSNYADWAATGRVEKSHNITLPSSPGCEKSRVPAISRATRTRVFLPLAKKGCHPERAERK